MNARAGFTVIELLVALLIGALVLAGAHRVLVGALDGVQRNGEARLALDREANARRLLAALLANIETGPGGSGFQGGPDRVAFTTWERDGSGYPVTRRVQIEVSAGTLVLRGLQPEPVPLLRDVTALGLDYLLETGANERFVGEWRSDASAPLAVRFRIARRSVTDTLLLIVGPRG